MNKKIITSSIVVIIGALVYAFFFAPGDTNAFLAAYNIYDTASAAEEISAHVPGVGENVPRQKLNEILSRVLTENLTPEDRQKLSEEGLVFASQLRTQVDVIGEEEQKTASVLAALRLASKQVGGFSAKRQAGSIVALADERMQTIKEVKDISYGINTKLESIFQGIITDHGVLTSERINALNQDLPEAEKQFDRLTENYRKLDTLEKQIDREFGDFQKLAVKGK